MPDKIAGIFLFTMKNIKQKRRELENITLIKGIVDRFPALTI